jgi:hypothetical protein
MGEYKKFNVAMHSDTPEDDELNQIDAGADNVVAVNDNVEQALASFDHSPF